MLANERRQANDVFILNGIAAGAELLDSGVHVPGVEQHDHVKEKNDSRKLELPLTAIYVIDQDRIIQYAFVNVDYRKRAEPFEVVEVLRTLKQG